MRRSHPLDVAGLVEAAEEEADEATACVTRAGVVAEALPSAWRSTPRRGMMEHDPDVAPFLHEYALHFGREPHCEVKDGPLALGRVTFDAGEVPSDNSFFTLPPALREEPASSAYLASLGFAWNGVGVVRTVPVPASFRRATRELGLGRFGLAPKVVLLHTRHVVREPWLRACLRGELAINLVSRFYYACTKVMRGRRARRVAFLREEWLAHFTTLGHDMSVHALASHLFPPSLLGACANRIETALHARRRGGRKSLVPLIQFYDSDLFLVCREAWKRAGTAAAVPVILASRGSVEDLVTRLEARIEEAQTA